MCSPKTVWQVSSVDLAVTEELQSRVVRYSVTAVQAISKNLQRSLSFPAHLSLISPLHIWSRTINLATRRLLSEMKISSSHKGLSILSWVKVLITLYQQRSLASVVPIPWASLPLEALEDPRVSPTHSPSSHFRKDKHLMLWAPSPARSTQSSIRKDYSQGEPKAPSKLCARASRRKPSKPKSRLPKVYPRLRSFEPTRTRSARSYGAKHLARRPSRKYKLQLVMMK